MLTLFRYSAMRFKGKTVLAGSSGLLSTCVILETIIFQVSAAYLGKIIETYLSFMVSLAGMTMGVMFLATHRDPFTDRRIGLVSGIAIAFGNLLLARIIFELGRAFIANNNLLRPRWNVGLRTPSMFFEPPALPRLP